MGDPIYVDHDNETLFTRKKLGTYQLLSRRMTQFGGDKLGFYLRKYNPDLLWVLCDMFMIPYIINMDLGPTKFLMYFPSDGAPLVETDRNIGKMVLEKAHIRVAMSKWAQEQAKQVGIEDCIYLPHGIEIDNFRPLDKMKVKQAWSQRLGIDLVNNFVLGTVSRYQGRKAVPELIKIFAEFAKDKPDVVLVLSMDPKDPAGGAGIDLRNLFKRYKIENKVVFSGTSMEEGLTKEEMAQLFNTFDLHVLATTGEGFGIPTLEAMACGVPSVITDFTTSSELVKGRGELVPLSTTITGTYQVERAFVDKKAFVEKLNKLYNDRELIKKYSKRSVKFAQGFDFETKIFPMWLKLFREILE
jgi:glycosyltransferase involved in cell wall biosynthesis